MKDKLDVLEKLWFHVTAFFLFFIFFLPKHPIESRLVEEVEKD